MPSKLSMERSYHTLLEDTLVFLRRYINIHVDEMDDIEIYDIYKLIRDIEQII